MFPGQKSYQHHEQLGRTARVVVTTKWPQKERVPAESTPKLSEPLRGRWSGKSNVNRCGPSLDRIVWLVREFQSKDLGST